MRQHPTAVNIDLIPVPPEILERHVDITFCTDVMFLHELPFIITPSIDLYFETGQLLIRNKDLHVVDGIREVKAVYKLRCFNLRIMKEDC